jgi:hypothetical protein
MMKKISIILLTILFSIGTAMSQTPVITMTTSNTVGSTITFDLGTNPASTVQVDFGNGTLVPKTIGTSSTTISGTIVGSQTVKVYGSGITILGCANIKLTALDVTQNTMLIGLNCDNNQLSMLNITKNTALSTLNCNDNLLTTLDVTQNTTLVLLNCNNNKLSTLDVTKNTALKYFSCSGNQLSNLDVTKNTALAEFSCAYNRLTFATLPLKQPAWYYIYDPQTPIFIAKDLITLDLSSQLTVNGNTTVYTWRTNSGIILEPGIDYTLTNGKTIFLKIPTDSVWCQMTNASFPNLWLNTSSTKIMNMSIFTSMTTSKAIGSSVSFTLAANANNSLIQVDFGDGNLVSKIIGTSSITITGNLVGSQTVKIYGAGVTYFNCSDNQLTILDPSRNMDLEILDCCYNQLTTLDVTKNSALTTLNCRDNRLTSLDVTKNASLAYLLCYYNQLTALDVTKNIALVHLLCYKNALSSLDVTRNTALKELYCNDNQFTFATLPLKQTTWTAFGYAPQSPIPIVKTLTKGAELDLRNQLTVNGNTTLYTWRTQSGTSLTQGTDYTLTSGKTIFIKATTDSVYCEMANAAFPDFAGSYVFKTTCVKVTGATDIGDLNNTAPEIYSHNKTLYINLAYKAQCSIFDINGRLIVYKPISSGANSMQLPNSGLYLVKISGNKDIVTKKVIVE